MFYKVLVQSASFHGHAALTYSSSAHLAVGTLVEVPLQRKTVLGVVTEVAGKPSFATKAIVRAYTELPPLPGELIKLADWLRQYYPAPLGIITQQIMPSALTDKHVANALESKIISPPVVDLPPLTAEQSNALAIMTKADTYVLHGETGSGKTRVYTERAIA
jgi:primosomal protein N'